MREESIASILEEQISGEWGEDGEGVAVLRSTNFTNEGRLNLKNVVQRAIEKKKVDKKKLVFGDSIIEKSGGSPDQPVGRVVYFDILEGTFLCSNFTSILRPKKEIDPRYFFWFLFYNHQIKRTLKYQNKTTGIINLQLARYLEETRIPLPAFPVQQKIATILDKADGLRQKDKQLLDLYNDLAQSVFYQMFGDPVKNSKKWLVEEIQNLMQPDKMITYGIVQAGAHLENGIPYIRTGDIKNNEILVDQLLRTSPKIALAYERSKVSKGDIIMSIRATVGTVALLPNELDGANLTQGTARISPGERVTTLYLFHFLRTQGAQHWIEMQTKGATFREITLTRLRQLPVMLPPKELQNKFDSIILNITKQLQIAHSTQKSSESLFQSLLQRAFRGELGKG